MCKRVCVGVHVYACVCAGVRGRSRACACVRVRVCGYVCVCVWGVWVRACICTWVRSCGMFVRGVFVVCACTCVSCVALSSACIRVYACVCVLVFSWLFANVVVRHAGMCCLSHVSRHRPGDTCSFIAGGLLRVQRASVCLPRASEPARKAPPQDGQGRPHAIFFVGRAAKTWSAKRPRPRRSARPASRCCENGRTCSGESTRRPGTALPSA
jgi:hypothetical protein